MKVDYSLRIKLGATHMHVGVVVGLTVPETSSSSFYGPNPVFVATPPPSPDFLPLHIKLYFLKIVFY